LPEDYQPFRHLTITREHAISIEYSDQGIVKRDSWAPASEASGIASGIFYRLVAARVAPSFFLVLTK
jgi:hypothetical protein